VLRFHELVGFGEFDAAFCSPSSVHLLVDLPNLVRLLTLVLVKRSFFHLSNRSDVKIQIGSEGDRLLVGHHLEEELAITPEGRAVGADHLMALSSQRGDEPTSAGFGVVGVTTEDDDLQPSVASLARHDQGRHKQYECEQVSDHDHLANLV
jgi:hypothetical protein